MNYNPEHMGAWLLGYDVAAISGADTIEAITVLIENKKDSLVLQMAKSLTGNEDALDVADTLLTSFTQGFQKNTAK